MTEEKSGELPQQAVQSTEQVEGQHVAAEVAATEAADSTQANTQSGGNEVSAKALVMTPLQGLVFALLAGIAAWGILQIIHPVFELPEEMREINAYAPEAQQLKLQAASKLVNIQNASLALVVFAAAVGLLMTIGELLLRGNALRAIWAGPLAAVVAGAVAIGAGVLGATVFSAVDLYDYPMLKSMIVQSAMLGVLGLGVGIAISLPVFNSRLLSTCIAGCVLGGLLAAFVYPPVVGLIFPNVRTESLLPGNALGRLLWLGIAAALIGITVTGLGKDKKKESVAAAASDGQ